MAKVQIAEIVLRFIDQMTGPMARTSREVKRHTEVIGAEFKKLERGIGSFVGAAVGLSAVTKEMGRLTEVMKEYSRVQQQILAMGVRPGREGGFLGTVGSFQYRQERALLTRESLQKSKDYNVSPTAVLEEIRALRSYGLSPRSAREASGPMLALARITGETDYLGMSKKIFGAATEFGLGLGESKAKQTSERMASTMLYLQSKNVTVSEFLEASKMSGTAAGQAGLGLQEYAGILAGLAQRQITGSQAGVFIRSAVSKMTKPTAQAIKAMKPFGGLEQFTTWREVTPERIQAALMAQFTLEEGGRMPTQAELTQAASIKDFTKRQSLIEAMARHIAPKEYAREQQEAPDVLMRQLEMANITRGIDVNLAGRYDKSGKWQAGIYEFLLKIGRPDLYGVIFEGRQLSRSEAAAASTFMTQAVAQAKIPQTLYQKQLAVVNQGWDAAFDKLTHSMERAWVRFGTSAAGKQIMQWINNLADFIDEMSSAFEKMNKKDQIQLIVDSLIALFAGIKLLLDFLQNNWVAAGFDATVLMGAVEHNPTLAKIVNPVLKTLGKKFVPKAFWGMFPGLEDAPIPPPPGDPRATGSELPTYSVPEIQGPPQPPPKKLTEPVTPQLPKHYDILDWFFSLPKMPVLPEPPKVLPKSKPGQIPPPATLDESKLEKHDEMLADMMDKNAVEVSAGFKNLPPALKKAFLESLQEWSGGNPGMAPGGVNGFGFGIGGTQLGGAGMGGIGAGGFRGGQFGGGQGVLSENGKAFMRRLIDKWHFSPASAAIAAGQVDWESAGFQPGISGDHGKSHGYGQWNAERWARLVRLAGGKWPDKELQTDYYAQEWINKGLSINEKDFSRFHTLGHAMEGYKYGPTAHEGDRIARGRKWFDWVSGKGDSGSVRGDGPSGKYGASGVSALGAGGLDPGFASRLQQLHEMAAKAGIHFRIQPGEGYRSFEEQARIYASHRGTGRPGARPGYSYHNYGRAGDLQHEDGTPLSMSELIALGRMAPQVGLTWGGHFRDPAHFQWGPAGGAGWLLRGGNHRESRIDLHIHDDGIRMAAKGDVPIRANYRGRRMAETTGRTSGRG